MQSIDRSTVIDTRLAEVTACSLKSGAQKQSQARNSVGMIARMIDRATVDGRRTYFLMASVVKSRIGGTDLHSVLA